MNLKQSLIFSGLLLFLTAGDISAQNTTQVYPSVVPITSQKQISTVAPVYFRIGESRLDMDFKQNRYNLAVLLQSISTILSDPNYVVRRFAVTGTSSPDGSLAHNMELAGRRAQSLANWLRMNVPGAAGRIEVVNGGENWTALRSMVSSSHMPYRNDMLFLIDCYPNDLNTRKYLMKTYADGLPWRWMTENLFPELRTGAGDTQANHMLSAASVENWKLLRSLIVADTELLSLKEKREALYLIDNMTDATLCVEQLKALNFGSTYNSIRRGLLACLLNAVDVASLNNWTFIREQVAASDIKGKSTVLKIIDNIPIYDGREKMLKQFDEGVSYQYIKDNIFPKLLTTSRLAQVNYLSSTQGNISLGNQNWYLLGKLLEISDVPNKTQLLELVNSPYSPSEKNRLLRAMNSGRDYNYIYSVFVPELLCVLTPAATSNWCQFDDLIVGSTYSNKYKLLDVIRRVSVADGRQDAMRSVDGGASLDNFLSQLFPVILTNTESSTGSFSGSGISVDYELSASARNRAELLTEQSLVSSASQSVNQSTNSSGVVLPPSGQRGGSSSQSVPKSKNSQSSASELSQEKKDGYKALMNIKTDLVQWAGVTSAFDGLHAVTPNLSLEFMFAGRWSVEAGGSYSNWTSFTGDREFWAVSQGWIEPRIYFGKVDSFRGAYAGVYGGYGSYDTQQGIIGHTGTHINVGVSVGYVQALSRSWYLELNVRGGYRMGTGSLYDIQDGMYYYNQAENTSGFAPQVRLNLTCRIFRNSK